MPYVASIGTAVPCRLGVRPMRGRLVATKTRSTRAVEDVVDRVTDRQVGMCVVGIGLDSMMHQHKRHLSHVDVAEVRDFFTGIELISYEDLGFAERFRGQQTRRSGDYDCRRGCL
jgi:hypothetical protein